MLILLYKNLVVQRPMNNNSWLKRGLCLIIIPIIQPSSRCKCLRRRPTLYWCPKRHKRPTKHGLLQIQALKLLLNFLNCWGSRFTAIRKHVIKFCDKVYERSGKNLFWSITIRMKFWVTKILAISCIKSVYVCLLPRFTLHFLIIL